MNTTNFDPYWKWLGISPTEPRPLSYYRLLGISLFENDTDVIALNADKQLEHLRKFSGGQQGEQAEQLINELTRAKLTLLNRDRKAAYDQQLNQQFHRPVAPVMAAQPAFVPQFQPAPSIPQFVTQSSSGKTSLSSTTPASNATPWMILASSVAVLGIVIALVVNKFSGSDETDNSTQTVAKNDSDKKSPAKSPTKAKPKTTPTTTPAEPTPVEPTPVAPVPSVTENPPMTAPVTRPAVVPQPMTPAPMTNVSPMNQQPLTTPAPMVPTPMPMTETPPKNIVPGTGLFDKNTNVIPASPSEPLVPGMPNTPDMKPLEPKPAEPMGLTPAQIEDLKKLVAEIDRTRTLSESRLKRSRDDYFKAIDIEINKMRNVKTVDLDVKTGLIQALTEDKERFEKRKLISISPVMLPHNKILVSFVTEQNNLDKAYDQVLSRLLSEKKDELLRALQKIKKEDPDLQPQVAFVFMLGTGGGFRPQFGGNFGNNGGNDNDQRFECLVNGTIKDKENSSWIINAQKMLAVSVPNRFGDRPDQYLFQISPDGRKLEGFNRNRSPVTAMIEP
jgi:hypothetical protein